MQNTAEHSWFLDLPKDTSCLRLLDLPLEIVNEIILLVPLIDRFRVSKVCRQFKTLCYQRQIKITTFQELRQAVYDGDIINILNSSIAWEGQMFPELIQGYYMDDAICGIFMQACYDGYLEIVQFLIYKGIDYFDHGLENACLGGHIEIVQLMINNGADNWDGAFCNAYKNGNIKIIELLIEHGAQNWDYGLILAHSMADKELIQFMLDHGATETHDSICTAD